MKETKMQTKKDKLLKGATPLPQAAPRAVVTVQLYYKDIHVATFGSVYALVKRLEVLNLSRSAVFAALRRAKLGEREPILTRRLQNWTILEVDKYDNWESPELNMYLARASEA